MLTDRGGGEGHFRRLWKPRDGERGARGGIEGKSSRRQARGRALSPRKKSARGRRPSNPKQLDRSEEGCFIAGKEKRKKRANAEKGEDFLSVPAVAEDILSSLAREEKGGGDAVAFLKKRGGAREKKTRDFRRGACFWENPLDRKIPPPPERKGLYGQPGQKKKSRFSAGLSSGDSCSKLRKARKEGHLDREGEPAESEDGEETGYNGLSGKGIRYGGRWRL